MKKDIESGKDIRELLTAFYKKIQNNAELSYFFSDVAKTDWVKHFETMTGFWENVLFYSGTYSGNPMQEHMKLHEKSKMTPEHFSIWNALFEETVNDLFEGENAEMIKQRAMSISTVMQIKLFNISQ